MYVCGLLGIGRDLDVVIGKDLDIPIDLEKHADADNVDEQL